MASIIDLLVKIQVLDERQREAVQSRARSGAGGHLVQQVAEMGWATEGGVARAISVELGLPRIDLAVTPPEPSALALLDARTCAERFVLPVALRENGELLWLAMADPTDEETLGIVRRKTQKRLRPTVAGPTEILRAVRALYANPGSTQPEAVEMPSRGHMDARSEAPAIFPQTDPSQPPFSFEELFTPSTLPGLIANDDLGEGEMYTLAAVRASLEKGTMVMRAVLELCVEKALITVEEIRKRKPPTGPIKTS